MSCVHRRAAGWGRGGGGGADGGPDFEEEFEEEERALESSGGARAWSLDDGPFKLVLIVNMQLKMGKGKARACACKVSRCLWEIRSATYRAR